MTNLEKIRIVLNVFIIANIVTVKISLFKLDELLMSWRSYRKNLIIKLSALGLSRRTKRLNLFDHKTKINNFKLRISLE